MHKRIYWCLQLTVLTNVSLLKMVFYDKHKKSLKLRMSVKFITPIECQYFLVQALNPTVTSHFSVAIIHITRVHKYYDLPSHQPTAYCVSCNYLAGWNMIKSNVHYHTYHKLYTFCAYLTPHIYMLLICKKNLYVLQFFVKEQEAFNIFLLSSTCSSFSINYIKCLS